MCTITAAWKLNAKRSHGVHSVHELQLLQARWFSASVPATYSAEPIAQGYLLSSIRRKKLDPSANPSMRTPLFYKISRGNPTGTSFAQENSEKTIGPGELLKPKIGFHREPKNRETKNIGNQRYKSDRCPIRLFQYGSSMAMQCSHVSLSKALKTKSRISSGNQKKHRISSGSKNKNIGKPN